jgi:hypothetical protein
MIQGIQTADIDFGFVEVETRRKNKMNKKNVLMSLMIAVMLISPMFFVKAQEPNKLLEGDEPPVIQREIHPLYDTNGNGIADRLEVLIADALSSDRGDEYAMVLVQTTVEVDENLLKDFTDIAGEVRKVYGRIGSSSCFMGGFRGVVQYNKITDWLARDDRIKFVEPMPEYVGWSSACVTNIVYAYFFQTDRISLPYSFNYYS